MVFFIKTLGRKNIDHIIDRIFITTCGATTMIDPGPDNDEAIAACDGDEEEICRRMQAWLADVAQALPNSLAAVAVESEGNA